MSLIATIIELKQYLALDANTKWGTLQPFVNEAEEIYLKPLLGDAFYDEIEAAYQASIAITTPVALTADQAALMPYIQRPLAYYTQLLAIDHLSVSWGDKGTRVHMGEDSMAAPRWAQEKLQFQAMRNGDTHADKLLKYLEDHAADFETWADSTANTKKSGLIVYSSSIAMKHIAINDSRRVYLKLLPVIREIETRIIPKLISKAQYDEIVTQLQAGTLTTENQQLTTKLESIIAKRALYMQLPFMRVNIIDGGVFLYSGLDELKKYFAEDADIKLLRQQLMDGEFGYLSDEQQLTQFINDNIADYPLIEASEVYTVQPDPGPTFKPNNSPNNKHFIA